MSQADELLASLSEVVIEHTHPVPDADTYFIIDPYTRQIENTTPNKSVLMRGDHNSERFTFELPRYVDGHDMSLCNRVIVHFDNVGDTIDNINSDVAYTDDLRLNPNNPDTVICSWLIRREATQIVGILSFSLQYLCVEEDEITYEWNTDSYDEIEIRKSKQNGEAAVTKYTNVLEQWRSQIFGAGDSVMANITSEGESQVAAVQNESATQQAAIELKGSETLATIPEDYTEVYNMATEAVRTKADGVVCEIEGNAITLTDSSDDYIRGLNLYGKSTQFTTTGIQLFNAYAEKNESFANATIENNGAKITVTGAYYVSWPITLKAGVEYYVDFTVSGNTEYRAVRFEYPDKEITNTITNPATFTPLYDTVSVYLYAGLGTEGTVVYENVQISEGSSALPWEAYTGGMASPNPDYPQEIESLENPVVNIYGKNLLNIHTAPAATLAATTEVDGESITVSSTDDSILTRAVFKLGYPKNVPLTISFDATILDIPSTNLGSTVRLRKGNQSTGIVMLDLTQVGVKKRYEITTDPLTEDGYELWLYLRTFSEASGYVSIKFENIQVEVGEEATEYEPYKQVQSITITQTLPGIIDLRDITNNTFVYNEVDLERGIYIQRLGDCVIDGAETFGIGVHTNGQRYAVVKRNSIANSGIVSDRYIGYRWCEYDKHTYTLRDNLVINDSRFTDKETAAAILAEEKPRFLYTLSTPIETPLTAEEIETYKSLRTNYPNTTIFNNTNAMMKVKYNADTKLYINTAVETGVVNVVEGVLNDTY